MDELMDLRRRINDLERSVAEDRNIQETLRRSEEKFHNIFVNMQDVYYEVAIDGIILEISPSAEKITKFKREELIGRSVGELYLDQEKRSDLLQNIQKMGSVTDYEIALKGKDNNPIIFSINSLLVRDEEGDPQKIIGSMKDITRRKEMELAIQESHRELERLVDERTCELTIKNHQLIQEMTDRREDEEKYRSILESMEEGYYEVDLAGNFTFFNTSLIRMLGYNAEELKGMNNRNYSDKETARKVFQAYNEVYRTGVSSRHVDWNLFRKDGARIYVESSVSLIKDRRGEPIGFRGIMLDVTDRKEAEKALQESQRRLADIIEFLPDATMVIDIEGKVIAWNRAMEEMTGVKAENILGQGDYAYSLPFYGERRPILIDLALRPDPEFEKKYSGIERQHHTVSGEAYMPNMGGGSIFLWGTATALVDAEGKIIGAIESIRDITERKQMEEEIKSLSITDPLTGLYNRRGFLTLAEQQMKISARSNKELLLIYIDLDGMKVVNDTLGHMKGDELLIEAAQVLKEVFRKADIIARMGGDEFAVLVLETETVSAATIGERLERQIILHNDREGRDYTLSMSAGMVSYNPEMPFSIDEWLLEADSRMYQQKRDRKLNARKQIETRKV